LTKKTQKYRYQNYCLDDNIQIYSDGLLCEHVLSMRTVCGAPRIIGNKTANRNKYFILLPEKNEDIVLLYLSKIVLYQNKILEIKCWCKYILTV
jgi:hypothetical protein